MNHANQTEITTLLGRIAEGDEAAEERLAEMTYGELRGIAQQLMRHEQPNSLQPTALVHEAYLKLVQGKSLLQPRNRAYFFAAASQAMRRILVDAARRRKSQKAGGERVKQPLDDLLISFEDRSIDLVALDEALDQLQQLNARQFEVVQLRWFGGFSVKEIAELLEVSVTTVESDWRMARAFLFQRITNDE